MSDNTSYDLTPIMGKYMDSHHLLMILVGLKDKGVYAADKITPEICTLLDEYTQLIPLLEEYTGNNHSDRLRMVGDRTDSLTLQLAPLLKVMENQDGELKSCSSIQQLDKIGVTREMMDVLYQWIWESYSVGAYQRAIDGLNVFQDCFLNILQNDGLLTDKAAFEERRLNVKWGLLAAYIADQKLTEAAQQALAFDNFLEDEVESGRMSKKNLLHQRTHLIHWCLFVLFKGNMDQSPISKLLDLVMSEKYLALVSLQCPHLLRYISAAFLMQKKLKSMTKDLIHVLSQDRANYSDALTEFLLALHHDMNFELAKTKLKEAAVLASSDYFLWDNVDQILSNARLAIFSIYCRIHQSVDIETVSSKMDMSTDAAETWIVSLIQAGRLSGACIKSDARGNSMVSFAKDEADIYQQVLDRTKNMSLRLCLLQANADQIGKKSGDVSLLATKIAKHLDL